jgi:EAL domain-containing protein (putative c-di-GMP-specific phosphodiesterase class I)
LKIDGRLVQRVLDDALDEAAVSSFITVAGIVNAKTVAPRVENEDVRRRLCELGIDFVQGYLLHRPAPLAQLLEPMPAP